MKCKMCKNEIESKEIRGTLGMRTGYCCSEVQVDIDSLRPTVKKSELERNVVNIFRDYEVDGK